MTDPNVWSQLFGRLRMMMAGTQFNGRRDLYELYGYRRRLTSPDHIARYVRQDIAKRVIDAPVMSTWADPPTISSDDTKFQAAWDQLLNPNGLDGVPIWQSIIRLDKLAGLGMYAGLLMGLDDGQLLSQPVKGSAPRKLLYLQPYHEVAMSVQQYEKDQSNPRYLKPVMYTVTPGKFEIDVRVSGASISRTSESRQPFNVHYSRMLHVAENLLEDNIYGRSRMEVVTNVLDDMLKVVGGSAELFWIMANRGIQVDVDKDMELAPEDEKNLTAEVQEYMDDMRRFIRTRGTKITNLGSDVADPTGVFNVLMSALSAATGQPKMIFTGSTLGTLASQQDRANWAERIGERITEYAEPIILKPFIAQLIQANVLPKPSAQIGITWPEAFKLSPLERAQTSAQMARSAANLEKVRQGAVAKDQATTPLFTDDEMRNIVGFDKHMPKFPKPKKATGTAGDAPPGDTAQAGDSGLPTRPTNGAATSAVN